jgi:hypothetical protein
VSGVEVERLTAVEYGALCDGVTACVIRAEMWHETLGRAIARGADAAEELQKLRNIADSWTRSAEELRRLRDRLS